MNWKVGARNTKPQLRSALVPYKSGCWCFITRCSRFEWCWDEPILCSNSICNYIRGVAVDAFTTPWPRPDLDMSFSANCDHWFTSEHQAWKRFDVHTVCNYGWEFRHIPHAWSWLKSTHRGNIVPVSWWTSTAKCRWSTRWNTAQWHDNFIHCQVPQQQLSILKSHEKICIIGWKF